MLCDTVCPTETFLLTIREIAGATAAPPPQEMTSLLCVHRPGSAGMLKVARWVRVVTTHHRLVAATHGNI